MLLQESQPGMEPQSQETAGQPTQGETPRGEGEPVIYFRQPNHKSEHSSIDLAMKPKPAPFELKLSPVKESRTPKLGCVWKLTVFGPALGVVTSLITILLITKQTARELETNARLAEMCGLAPTFENPVYEEFKQGPATFVFNNFDISPCLSISYTAGLMGFTATAILILCLYVTLFLQNRRTGYKLYSKCFNTALLVIGFFPPLGLVLLTIVNEDLLAEDYAPNPFSCSDTHAWHIVFMLVCFGAFALYELVTIIGFGKGLCATASLDRPNLCNWLLFVFWICCLTMFGICFLCGPGLAQKLAVMSIWFFSLGFTWVFYDLNQLPTVKKTGECDHVEL